MALALAGCVVKRENPDPEDIGKYPSPAVAATSSSTAQTAKPDSEPPPTPAQTSRPCGPARGNVFSLRDTTEWETDVGGGKRALLYVGSVLVDTIDVEFGVHRIGRDSLVFLPVHEDDIDRHVVFDGTTCVTLNATLPYLDDYFSSPMVEGTRFHYWGLRQIREGMDGLYAMRFDFGRSRLDSLFLDSTGVGTDYRYHFHVPKISGDTVEYATQGVTYLVDSSYKRLTRRLLSPPSP